MAKKTTQAQVEFTAETQSFKEGINEANKSIRNFKDELKLNSAQLKNDAENVDLLAQRKKILQQQTDESKRKIDLLSEELEIAKRVFGDNSEETEKLTRQLRNAQIEYENIQGEVNKTDKKYDELTQSTNELGDELEDSAHASDKAKKGLKDLGDASEKTSEGFTVMKGALANLVADGLREAGQAMVQFAKDSIQTGIDFQASMSEVGAISGATGKDLSILEQTAKDYGASTVFSASESAQALKYMALAGWDANQSCSALGGVLNLASSSGMELAKASDMVTDYMSAFNMEASQSAYFADMLAYAQSHANTTAEQLGEAYKNCAASLNASGQSVETVTSLLSMMANQGFKGSEAGTALTAIMRDITKNMKNGAIAIGDTNVQVKDSQGNFRDLNNILFDVQHATYGMGDAERASALALSFTADSTKGLNLLLNAGIQNSIDFKNELKTASMTMESFDEQLKKQGSSLDEMRNAFVKAGSSAEYFDDLLGKCGGNAELFGNYMLEDLPLGADYAEILESIGLSADDVANAMKNATGTAEGMSKVMNDNLKGDMAETESALEDLQISLYEGLEPSLREIMQSLTDDVIPFLKNDVLPIIKDIFNFITDNKDILISAILGIGTALLVFNIGSILSAVSTAIVGLGGAISGVFTALMANPMGLIIGLIAGVVVAIVTLWNKSDAFRGFVLGAWETIKNTFSTVGEWFKNSVIDPVVNFFKGVWDNTKKKYRKIKADLIVAKEAVCEVFDGIKEFIGKVWDGIVLGVTTFFKICVNLFDAGFQLITLPFRFIWENCKEYVFEFFGKVEEKINEGMAWISEHIIEPIKKTVATVVEKFNEVKEKVSAKIEEIKSAISDKFNWIKDVVSEIVRGIKDAIVGKFLEIKDGVVNKITELKEGAQLKFKEIKLAIMSPIHEAKVAIEQKVDDLKKGFNDKVIAIKTTVSNVFNSIKDKMTGPVETAKAKIKSVVESIKGFFKFTMPIPKLKLPHFSISPKGWKLKDLLQGSVPKLSIAWNKDGGIFTSPTIFGTNKGLQGVGEAGAEAILPLERLESWVNNAMQTSTRNAVNYSSEKIDQLIEVAEKILGKDSNLYVNGNNLSKALGPSADSVSGDRISFTRRGLAIE